MMRLVMMTMATLCVMGNARGQELDLFQATENPENTENSPRRPQRGAPQITEPAFTLVGTSRFGEEYNASLLSRDGSRVKVNWSRTDGILEIKGYAGYGLAEIGSRSVTIRMPNGEDCIESEEKGVQCNGNMALLTLATARAIPAREPASRQTNNSVNTASASDNLESGQDNNQQLQNENNNGRALPLNPFSGEVQQAPNLSPEEIAAREARRVRRQEQFRNFEIVRIPDDEIPEGMQRVRTPFGDSLVPEGEDVEDF